VPGYARTVFAICRHRCKHVYDVECDSQHSCIATSKGDDHAPKSEEEVSKSAVKTKKVRCQEEEGQK
jgi:hypothetical protein